MKLYRRDEAHAWAMRFSYEGERIDRTTGFKDYKKAEAYAEAFRTKLRNEGVGLLDKEKKEIPKFIKAVESYHRHIEKRLRETTIRRSKLATDVLLTFFKTKRLDKITSTDIENFINKRSDQYVRLPSGKIHAKKETVSAATINKELGILKNLFNLFISRKVVSENPVCGVQFLDEVNAAGRVLNNEEIDLYLKECTEDFGDFVKIMLETGMRPGELSRITFNHINLNSRVISIDRKITKTKAGVRSIPMSQQCYEVFAKRNQKPHGLFVFAGRYKKSEEKPIVKFNNSHYAVLRRSKIDKENRTGTIGKTTIYSMRHTFATRFVEAGGDLVTLAKLLGHANLKMVMRYAHPSDAHAAAAIQRMSSLNNITPNSNQLMQNEAVERKLHLVKNAA